MTFNLAYARGDELVHSELRALGRSGWDLVELDPEAMVPLPPGSTLMALPGRAALGVDGDGDAVELEGAGVSALAAVLPLGWTRALLPGTWPRPELRDDERLPLYGYAAVAHREGGLWAAAWRSDTHAAWSPSGRAPERLAAAGAALLAALPGNRLVEQLQRCATVYRCFTAQNTLLGVGEGALPVSGACNAACLGCISEQIEAGPGGADLAPQARLDFNPTLEEVAALGQRHLAMAEGPDVMISFGQGCEGEPMLRPTLLEAAIRRMRSAGSRGTIHLNTNGSRPQVLRRLAQAGLGGVRISVISTLSDRFEAYYRPRGYGLAEVEECLRVASEEGLRTSVNWLTLPGLSDRPEEVDGLAGWVQHHGVHQLQLRTLNVDYDWALARMPGLEAVSEGDEPVGLGMAEAVSRLTSSCPQLDFGNFSRGAGQAPPGQVAAAPALALPAMNA